MEKEKGSTFKFDLEDEIKKKPNRKKEILEHAEKQIHQIKKLLREGTNEKDFDKLGVLLHGYAALQKVIKKVAN